MAKYKSNKLTGRRWFGARSYISICAVGKQKSTDRQIKSTDILIEERVCLFLANSAADAIRMAEHETRRYCRKAFHRNDVNRYGQRLAVRPAGYDVFDLFDTPANNAEVFSSMWIMKKDQFAKLLAVSHKKQNDKTWDKRLSKFIGTRPDSQLVSQTHSATSP